MYTVKNRILCFLVLILLLWVGSACAESAGGWIIRREDLNGKRMGIVTGTSFEAPTLQYFPDSQYLYFSTNSDVVTALTSNKIDGFLADEPVIRMICKEVPEITYLSEKITQDDYAFGFAKNSERADKIRGQFNEMLSQIMADGTMNALYEKWFGDDEAAKVVDLTGFSGENGTLNVVTNCASLPFSYIKNGKMAGIAIELTEMFCRRYGYTPHIEDVDAAARIPGIVTGKYDMCASPLTITEERRESINFSDPYYQGGIVLAVRKADVAAQTAESAGLSGQGTASTLDALNGKRIGVPTGTNCGPEAEARLPDAKIKYYNNHTDMLIALRSGKVDAIVTDAATLRFLQIENDDLEELEEKFSEVLLAPVFPKTEKGEALCGQYSAFVQKLRADGTLDALAEVWLGKAESLKTVLDYEALQGPNGTLTMALDATLAPFAYMKNGRIVGYDVDIAARFCEANGYRLKIVNSSFDGVLASVQSGKCDFAACGITKTDERAERILFGEPDFYSGNVAAVLKQNSASSSASAASGYADLQALNGKRVGVQTGTICGPLVEAAVADAQVSYFNSQTDLLAALKSRKIDAWCHDEPVIRFLSIDNPEIKILDGYLAESNLAAIFPKTEAGQTLRDQYSAFVEKLWADGTMQEIDAVWFGTDEEKRTVLDYGALPASNGTLRMAVDTSVLPFAYIKENRVMGYDVDIAARFCQEYGYRLETVQMSFDGALAAVQSGKCDFAACCITITEERAESMLFSSPNYYGGIALAVLDEGGSAPRQDGGISSLSELNDKRIGVATGTTFDGIVLKALPDAKPVYINTAADLIAALESGKIDGFAVDEPAAKQFCVENPRLTVVDEYMDTFAFGIVLPKTSKGEALLEELNTWLVPMKESGALEQVIEKWAYGPDEGKTLPDYAAFPATKGTLTLATEGDYVPMTYYRGTEIVGAEIDLVAQFCEASGYGLKVQVMNFDGILPAVQTGKADFAAAGISITDERRESVNFSVPYYSGGTVMVVLKDPALVTEQAAKTVRWQDYNGKRIGVLVGPLMEDAAKEYFPDSEYLLFNTYPDCIAALLAGKIDAYLGDELGLFAVHAEQPEIDYIHDRITQNNYAFAFRKNDPDSAALCAELNDFLKRSRENGTMEDLENIWYGIDEEKKVVDMSGLTGENGTIRVVTTSTDAPFSYIKDGKNVGYDIDLVVRFCRDRGYTLELGDVDFAGRIPAIQSGKYDFTTDMNVTPERQEQVLFSDPTGYGGIVLAVLSSDLAASDASQVSTGAESAEKSFLDSIQDSFNKTFIRENRWELFWNGVLTTLLITVLSILFGTALGFLVFMLCRNGNIVANGVTRFSMWLVQGMPMVVLLMILYYIIFGSVAISGIFVAVIGFTLTFGASVFGLLKMGVGTIDRGQYEAAYALGYANRRTFFRIILPQAIPHILPAYKGEIVGLIKATAIVGYIAVQDLTKMGDIVRSRTYEAFFPLIAVTVIYFILEGLLGFLVSKIQIRMNPKKRRPENILKGVKLHD